MMDTFMLKPTVLAYDTCKEMAEALQIGEGDLMITNKYIYDPYFADLNLKCDVLFQEKAVNWLSCRRHAVQAVK